MSNDLQQRILDFLEAVTKAMGFSPGFSVHDHPDGIRINLEGGGSEELLRRKGEALEALQHVTNAVFRDDLTKDWHVLVDCMDFRKGKEAELRQMARFLGDRVKATGVPQEMGPLNPYARRIVHLAVAEDPDLASESVGDAFVKTVIISLRKA